MAGGTAIQLVNYGVGNIADDKIAHAGNLALPTAGRNFRNHPSIAPYTIFWNIGHATRAPMRAPVTAWPAMSGVSGV